MKYLIGLPKRAKTRYAVIDYHNGSNILINFDDFKDEEKLRNQLSRITWQGNGNDFENLLVKAKDVFEMSKKSRKVFMIFINDRLNTDLNVIRNSVRMVNSLGVKVIVVRIGDRVNDQEISAITSSTVVRSRTTDGIAKTGDLAGSATLKGEVNLSLSVHEILYEISLVNHDAPEMRLSYSHFLAQILPVFFWVFLLMNRKSQLWNPVIPNKK